MEPIALLSLLFNAVKFAGERLNEGSSEALNGLLAINQAAKKTLMYETWREANDNGRDKVREQEISFEWYGVSYHVMGFSGELGMRLQHKGDYWQAPELWTQLEIQDTGIGLERVVNETERLLQPYLKKH